jgi:hypothetical protein
MNWRIGPQSNEMELTETQIRHWATVSDICRLKWESAFSRCQEDLPTAQISVGPTQRLMMCDMIWMRNVSGKHQPIGRRPLWSGHILQYRPLISIERDIKCGFTAFLTEIGLLQSIFLKSLSALSLTSLITLRISFHISHPIVKMDFHLICQSDRCFHLSRTASFRSHVTVFLEDSWSESALRIYLLDADVHKMTFTWQNLPPHMCMIISECLE